MSKNQLIISLDFDLTLSEKEVQDFYKKHRNKVQFVIVTRRFTDLHAHLWKDNPTNKQLWKVVEDIAHPKHHVYFCNMRYKHEFLRESSVVAHLDDDPVDVAMINQLTHVKGILFQGNWEQQLIDIINANNL